MSVIAAALKHMLAAGMPHDAIIGAVEAMEAVQPVGPTRSNGAVRQARYADRQRQKASESVTPDANDADAEITRPLPSSPPGPPQLPTPTRENITTRARRSATDKAKGERLSDGWLPGWTYTPTDFGLSDEEHAGELAKFRDYWRGVPGGSGRKLDWDATWRNWMRRASNDLARRKPNVRTGQSAKFEQRHENYRESFAGAKIAAGRRAVEPQSSF